MPRSLIIMRQATAEILEQGRIIPASLRPPNNEMQPTTSKPAKDEECGG